MRPCRQQEEEEPDGGDTVVRVKYDARLHGARVAGRKEPLTTAFLQKYIQYAKNRYKCEPGASTKSPLVPVRSSAEYEVRTRYRPPCVQELAGTAKTPTLWHVAEAGKAACWRAQ